MFRGVVLDHSLRAVPHRGKSSVTGDYFNVLRTVDLIHSVVSTILLNG